VVVYIAGPSGPVDPDAHVRVGVVVSKAVGGSVERHRAARRIRHAIRPLLVQLPKGACVVVRALPGADQAASLEQDLVTSVNSARDRT
jgi:ribonuclease P protein component